MEPVSEVPAKRSVGFKSTENLTWSPWVGRLGSYAKSVEFDGLVWNLRLKASDGEKFNVSMTAELQTDSRPLPRWEIILFNLTGARKLRKLRDGVSVDWISEKQNYIIIHFMITFERLIGKCAQLVSGGEQASHLPATFLGRLLGQSQGAEPAHFEDFELRAQGQRLPIHRAVFAAASDVFRKLFEEPMGERAQGFAEVADVPFAVLLSLKRFLYTGQLEEEENFEELLNAAEKYQIGELKKACGERMGGTLSSSSLCRTAVLAERFGLAGLREACGELLRGLPKAQQTALPDWAQLKKDHPALGFHLLGL